MKTLESKWQHVYICFDGRMEQVYINGQLISEKDIQLLIKTVTIRNFGAECRTQLAVHGLPAFTETLGRIYSDEKITP